MYIIVTFLAMLSSLPTSFSSIPSPPPPLNPITRLLVFWCSNFSCYFFPLSSSNNSTFSIPHFSILNFSCSHNLSVLFSHSCLLRHFYPFLIFCSPPSNYFPFVSLFFLPSFSTFISNDSPILSYPTPLSPHTPLHLMFFRLSSSLFL